MVATWHMESNTICKQHVLLQFYSGRAKSGARFKATLRGAANEKSVLFSTQLEADQWALEYGIQRWSHIQSWRAYPEAEIIPIRFRYAPRDHVLDGLVSLLEAGATLHELANEITPWDVPLDFRVRPNLLRLWLIGAAPNHPATQKLKNVSNPPFQRNTWASDANHPDDAFGKVR